MPSELVTSFGLIQILIVLSLFGTRIAISRGCFAPGFVNKFRPRDRRKGGTYFAFWPGSFPIPAQMAP